MRNIQKRGITRYRGVRLLFIILLLLLAGCASPRQENPTCTVLFEDNANLYFPNQIYEIKRGEDLSLSIGVPHGERIASVNYEEYSISAKTGESLSYDYYTLTLHHIRYSVHLSLTTAASYTTVYRGTADSEPITVIEESPHLRYHTLPYREQFSRPGYQPIGWNTQPDGSGLSVGFGSRMDHRDVQELSLYMEWLPETDVSSFSYTIIEGEVTITGYEGSGDLVIPAMIEGYPVTTFAQSAFGDVEVEVLVLPATLRQIAPGAFGKLVVEDLYFYDNIESLPEEAFASYEITHLHINAVLDPVYSGSYFDTLADKVDYLYSLQEQKKLILFCGSSARFGYDSALLESSFPEYRVINMGVYAYSNMLPQAHLLLPYLREGDLILSSPEFDAIEQQFCGSTVLDKETFCMMESNYDLFAGLDCTQYTQIFTAFAQYNEIRRDMSPRSYLDSPSYYDEDRKEVPSPSYNRFGDYILFRENNSDGKTFGIKRAFYAPAYFTDQDLTGLNAVYDAFAERGARVFFTYSPRSQISLSPDSTPEAIQELDTLLRETLHAPVISPIQDSLMDPFYFHGTDNHLSTEGVALRTNQVIRYLQTALEELP